MEEEGVSSSFTLAPVLGLMRSVQVEGRSGSDTFCNELEIQARALLEISELNLGWTGYNDLPVVLQAILQL